MRRIAAALLLASCGLARFVGADPAVEFAPDERALLAWYDSLGFPDVTKLPFVAMTNGNHLVSPVPTPIVYAAFLLAEDAGGFTVFTTELRRETYRRSPPDTPLYERVGFVRANLSAEVADGVARMRAVPGPIDWALAFDDARLDPFLVHQYQSPNEAFRMVVLARACAGRGRADLARSLLDLALRESNPREAKAAEAFGRFAGVRADLADEAHGAMRARLADPAASLGEIRDDLRRFVAACPDHARAADARDDVAILTRMIAEEAAPRPVATGGTPRLEDPVFALRRISGQLYLGGHSRRYVPGTGDDEPLFAVVRVGLPAVPALLAAIDDRTFTRALLQYPTGQWQYRPPKEPYRVEDAAIDALDAISDRAVRDADESGWSLHSREEPERRATRERIRAWARAVEQGESARLAFDVERGTERSPAAAERLAKTDPGRALAAILRGVRAASRPAYAARLVETTSAIPGDAATAALLDLLAHDERLLLRIAAAEALLARGRTDGVAPMVALWRDPARSEEVATRVAAFLVHSLDPTALRALARGLDAAPDALREEVVTLALLNAPDPPQPPAPDAAAALEDLLGARLGDPLRVDSFWHRGPGTAPLSLGAVAARALGAWLPDVYRLDPKASPDAQRAVAEALYRSRRPGR